jgi:hypothetical protein
VLEALAEWSEPRSESGFSLPFPLLAALALALPVVTLLGIIFVRIYMVKLSKLPRFSLSGLIRAGNCLSVQQRGSARFVPVIV